MGFFTKDFLILVCQTCDWETFKLETPPVHLQTPIGMILLLVGVDTSHIVVIKTVLAHISSISSLNSVSQHSEANELKLLDGLSV